MFTKKTVTVVEMTPSGPSAWSRRGVNTSFTQCHLPDVFREAMVDAAENCDDPGIEPAPEYPAGMRYPEFRKFPTCPKCADEASGKAAEAKDAPSHTPGMSRSPEKLYQSHVKAQFNFFREKFDHALLDKASAYNSHRLDMYRLFKLEGAVELAESNPVLAFMIALNRTFCTKKDADTWNRAKTMLKMKRRKILSMCGFQESESLVRIFGRIGLENVTVKNILLIRKALKRNPELLRTLSFVESYRGDVITLATLPELSDSVTAQFLNEAGRISKCSDRAEYTQLVKDTVRMSSILGENLGRLGSRKDLQRRHDALIVPYTAKMKLGVMNASFPEPPFDGASSPDFEIHPVRSPEMLYKWATRQHNCIMTRFAKIILAESAIYTILKPVESTLEILRTKTGNGWRLGDLKGTCNNNVSDKVIEHVEKWFNERRCSPRRVEASESVANFTLSDFYAHFAGVLPVPEQYEYDPRVDDVLNENELERNSELARGPLPKYQDSDFSVKPVRRAGDMAEVLYSNHHPPKEYLKLAKSGDCYAYVTGISTKRLVFLSAKSFPESKIEIERVYPHSDRILARLREWIDNYVHVNGFPLPFKDENQ
ncbi:MAG: hypothetical protein WCP55_20805, partial [Lentisphaerota bacterium]